MLIKITPQQFHAMHSITFEERNNGYCCRIVRCDTDDPSVFHAGLGKTHHEALQNALKVLSASLGEEPPKKVTRFKCQHCGCLTTGRLPHKYSDGAFRYPRRHRLDNGKGCPGNIIEAEWVTVEIRND